MIGHPYDCALLGGSDGPPRSVGDGSYWVVDLPEVPREPRDSGEYTGVGVIDGTTCVCCESSGPTRCWEVWPGASPTSSPPLQRGSQGLGSYRWEMFGIQNYFKLLFQGSQHHWTGRG